MEELRKWMNRRLKTVSLNFIRFLYDEIDWSQRLIIVKGARGTGKTTLLLQRIKKMKASKGEVLYVSMDDPYFSGNEMYRFAEAFYEAGGRYLFLDEIHRYEHWSRDLKWIYDNLPALFVIVSGSSALNILKGEADLSRRAVVHNLPGLSFREFTHLKKDIALPVLPLASILQDHSDLAADMTDQINVAEIFQQYLQYGYYPFFTESINAYHDRLLSVINLVLDSDIPSIFEIDYHSVQNARKLLYILSESVPFKPNITSLSRKTQIHRNTILRIIDILDAGHLIYAIRSGTKGVSYLAKPDKIYLENTNLMYALSHQPVNKGQLRETFFMNQLKAKHDIAIPRHGDFLVDGQYIFEVGGPNKGIEQVKHVPESYLAIDEIKGGRGKRIPLWLFGFLY